ncbi:MATE family efflux transporter [Oscillospiraceae bacterium OttesenSCG-928-F05]|nr:MATE family efflux transporter [Oscillospiraceae bacterium OttesenSCG-928-F05]
MAIFVRDKSFYKTLVRLALPIALQNFVTFGVAFADNLMVGSLGGTAIAGVYMGNQIQVFLQFFVQGVDQALLIIAAQYWGKRDGESIKRLAAVGTAIVLTGGILLTVATTLFPAQLIGLFTNEPAVIAEAVGYVRIVCVSYVFFCLSQLLISTMRSVENVKIGLYISVTALVTNIIFNSVFIFGLFGVPAMGSRGAALATVISRVIEFAVIFVYVLRVDTKLRMRIKDFFIIHKPLFGDFVRYGAPVLGGQVVWAVNMLAQSAIIGRMGEAAITSVSITGMLSNLLFVWIMGLGAGVGILTGKTVGAGEYEKMKTYAYTVQIMLLGLGVISGIIIFFVKDYFLMLYTLDEGTLAVAKQFMTVLAVAAVGRAYQAICLAGLVKAGGDVGFVFLNDTIFVFGVVLPSALIAMNVFHAAPWVVYACLQSDQILKCFVAVVKINRFKWMKNLTRRSPEEKPA